MSGHARLSPSSADRWMVCPGSIRLSEGLEDTSSEFADEGTAAHTLASWCLTEHQDALAYQGRRIPVGHRTFEVDADMAGYVQSYVDAVRGRMEEYRLRGATSVDLYVEQAVPIGHLTGEEGATGTSDAIIVAVFADGQVIVDVGDLKYGRGVEVVAQENRQGMIYTLGVIEKYSLVYDFTHARITIYQPRMRTEPSDWEVSIEDLKVFAGNVRAAADLVEHACERVDEKGLDAYLTPSEKGCKFCKAKATCPALAKFVQEEVGADFEAIVQQQKAPPPDFAHSLASQMKAVDLIDDWCRAVRAEVERRLLAGDTVDGFKLVQGKRGSRAWVDEEAVEQMLRKQFRLKVEDAYNLKLISPTQAEKLLKESPKRWASLQPLIGQSEGKPSVAPVTDKRPALAVESASDDFAPVAPETADDLI